MTKREEITDEDIIRSVAIDWVCPYTHKPSTPYEHGEIKKLIRFADDLLLALNNKGENIKELGLE